MALAPDLVAAPRRRVPWWLLALPLLGFAGLALAPGCEPPTVAGLELGEAINSFPVHYPPPGAVSLAVAIISGMLVNAGALGAIAWLRGGLSVPRAVGGGILLVLVTLAILEVAIADYSERQALTAYRPHPLLMWVHPPYMPPPSSTNRDGLRGPDRPLEKPPGTIRILLLGGSPLWGHEVLYEESCAARLEDQLNASAPAGTRFEVINGAVQGYTSAQGLEMLRLLGLRYQPDALILGFNNEPTVNPLRDRDRIPSGPLRRGLQQLLYRSHAYLLLRKVLFMARVDETRRALVEEEARPRDVQTRRVPVDDYVENMRDILSIAAEHHMRCMVLRMPRLPSSHAEDPMEVWFQASAGLVRERGALVVDLFHDWKARKADHLFLPADAVHPNAEGHRQMAVTLFRAMRTAGWWPLAGGTEGGPGR